MKNKKNLEMKANEETKDGPVDILTDFSAVKFQREAYASFDKFYNPVNDEDYTKIYMNFTLSCFCQYEYDKHGMWLMLKNYRRDGYNMLPPQMLADIEAQEEEYEPHQHICWSYVA